MNPIMNFYVIMAAIGIIRVYMLILWKTKLDFLVLVKLCKGNIYMQEYYGLYIRDIYI